MNASVNLTNLEPKPSVYVVDNGRSQVTAAAVARILRQARVQCVSCLICLAIRSHLPADIAPICTAECTFTRATSRRIRALALPTDASGVARD